MSQATTPNDPVQDLLIVTDATGSMGYFLQSLRQSLPEILALSKLSGVFERIGIIAYRDYCDPPETRIQWSGWNQADLEPFAKRLTPDGGGDWPEAAKTALIEVLHQCDYSNGRQTLVLWFADAPPHAIDSNAPNAVKERKHCESLNYSTDWVQLSYLAKERQCTVFSIAGKYDSGMTYNVFLSEVTGGRCVFADVGNDDLLSRLTVDIILQWNGLFDWADSEQASSQSHTSSAVKRFDVHPLQRNPAPAKELDENGFLQADRPSSLVKSPVDLSIFPFSQLAHSASRRSAAARFADTSESTFRTTVYSTLESIISSNVHALTYNPVFGQLWRAVCKDTDEANVMLKQSLVDSFSRKVSQLSDSKQMTEMQQWLEDSFDSSAEIQKIIESVDADGPRAYLDLDSGVELTRKELLEVAKSCYSGVLTKLATIFTHLKLADKDAALAPKQRWIPLSLPPRDFFRILPHLVVPGTLYSHRAASLTAILALVTGVPFLQGPAIEIVQTVKGTWLNIEIPENISYECARFLLSAPAGAVLTDDERSAYEGMRRMSLFEQNKLAPLDADMPWTPQKVRGVGDFKISCTNCNMLRSVTVMSHEQHGVCGLCQVFESKLSDVPGADINGCDEMDSCWVECSVKTCRAQYVVEDVGKLLVRPKCHYCRMQLACPYIECSRCTNRIVFPKSYREPLGVTDEFVCPGCTNPERETVEKKEVNIDALRIDNGQAWLKLRPEEDLLQGKSAFKLVKAHGFEIFSPPDDAIDVAGDFSLMFEGKKVLNSKNVIGQVERRVNMNEVDFGCCPLCFNDIPHSKLGPSCGRTGCKYRVDERCLKSWYGTNEAGKLLNVMQTKCPFCRRIPATKVLRRYNQAVASLGGLRDASEDATYFYAWCGRCGFAKRAYERQCCDGDRLPAVANFVCEDCREGSTSVTDSDAKRLTACPKCGVMVEKEYGCNHINCNCGQHFCHVCGSAESAETIYAHMSKEHGSFYDFNVDDDDYDLDN